MGSGEPDHAMPADCCHRAHGHNLYGYGCARADHRDDWSTELQLVPTSAQPDPGRNVDHRPGRRPPPQQSMIAKLVRGMNITTWSCCGPDAT